MQSRSGLRLLIWQFVHGGLRARYERLSFLRKGYIIRFNKFLVDTSTALGLAPKGMKEVHDMLVNVASSLIAGGESGIFSPMHLLLFQKPDVAAAPAPAAAGAPAKAAPVAVPKPTTAPKGPPPAATKETSPQPALESSISIDSASEKSAGSGLSADAPPFDPIGKAAASGKAKSSGGGKQSSGSKAQGSLN
eukprot:jgi/Botrbrau1/1802/Bobra.146_1s0001.1